MHKTGATRYQKFLKSEKAKTKLKSKKELPKGTNVTKTNFKVKKIVIKEQLKKHEQTELLSSKKLNSKELLSRLSHFNTNARMEALTGIKELITIHPKSVEDNLGQFIHGVTPLVLNIEKTVRRESITVVHLLFTNVSLDKIEPFFDVLSTYLRSAMTHIDNRIQEDSLLFLDVLIMCSPQLIALDFHKIIPNFLDMISKLKSDSKGRTLTVNLNSQITSVKWRIKVFHRLQQFIHKFAEFNDIYKTERITNEKVHIFNPTCNNTFPLFNPVYTSVCSLSCFSPKNSQIILISDEVEKFRSYVETLMPLLFEIWLEACPNVKKEKIIETVITEDAAILLKHILEVISLVWKLVKHFNKKYPSGMLQKDFSQKYRSQFSQNFVTSFPYITSKRTRLNKNENIPFEIITDPKLTAENLEICYLYITINPNINVNKHQPEIVSILKYIEKNFSNQSHNDVTNISLRILHTIFSKEITNWSKKLKTVETLFIKIIQSYFNDNLSKSFKEQIFALLCKISINDNLVNFYANDEYKSWLTILPNVLLDDTINNDTVDILHKFAISNNPVFNSIVKPKLKDIIQNLPKLNISDCSTNGGSYYKLFSILYWIKMWDEESLNLLEQQITNGVYRSDYGKYILDVLKSRTGNM